MSDLAHARAKLVTASQKVVRNVHSYQVETNFLTSQACQEGLIHNAGVWVCRCLRFPVGARPRPIWTTATARKQVLYAPRRFCGSGRVAPRMAAGGDICQGCSSDLCQFACLLLDGLYVLERKRWKMGRKTGTSRLAKWYVQPALQGSDQLEKVASGWTNRLPSFEAELGKLKEVENVNLKEIGAR